MSTNPVRYLSLEWIDALTQAVASNEAIAAIAADHTVGITQTVTGGPEGDVTYHLQVAESRASFGPVLHFLKMFALNKIGKLQPQSQPTNSMRNKPLSPVVFVCMAIKKNWLLVHQCLLHSIKCFLRCVHLPNTAERLVISLKR